MQNLFNKVDLRFEFQVTQLWSLLWHKTIKLIKLFIQPLCFDAVYFLQIFFSSFQSFSEKYKTKLNSIFSICGKSYSYTKVWMHNLEFKSWNLSTIQLLIPVKSFLLFFLFVSYFLFRKHAKCLIDLKCKLIYCWHWSVSTFEFLMRLEKKIRHWFEK